MRGLLSFISRPSVVLLGIEAAFVAGTVPQSSRELGSFRERVQPQNTYTIAFLQSDAKDPWHAQLEKDLKTAAGKYAEIRFVTHDAAGDAKVQAEHITQLASDKVNLIILSPVDAAIGSKLPLAAAANIPVVVLDHPVDGSSFTTFIGVENRLIGREAGKWIAKKLAGKGSVVEIRGSAEDEVGRARSEPFRDAIKGGEIRIVHEAVADWSKEKAREHMQQALSANPEKGSITLVYGASDEITLAAYDVAKEAKRDEEMLFVAAGALPDVGLRAVKDGVFDAAFERTSGASLAIDTALLILNGKTVPAAIPLGTRLYTPENIEKGGEEIKPDAK